MPMTQDRINSNVVNSLSVLNKAIQNILVRQRILLMRDNDIKNADLSDLDMQLLVHLQQQLDQMKAQI